MAARLALFFVENSEQDGLRCDVEFEFFEIFVSYATGTR